MPISADGAQACLDGVAVDDGRELTGSSVSSMTGSVADGTADCDGDGAMRSEPPAADGGRAEALNPSAPA